MVLYLVRGGQQMYVVNRELLKERRKAKRLSLEAIAKALGLSSRMSYYHKEVGERPFKDKEIAILVPLLGITFNDFFKRVN